MLVGSSGVQEGGGGDGAGGQAGRLCGGGGASPSLYVLNAK